jgi:hypothetical protein
MKWTSQSRSGAPRNTSPARPSLARVYERYCQVRNPIAVTRGVELQATGLFHSRTIGPEGRDLPLRNKPHFDALIFWGRSLRETGRRAALDCPERVTARETTNAGYFFSKPL